MRQLEILNYLLGAFVASQPKEHRLTKPVVVRPLRKLDLGDQYWFDPRTVIDAIRLMDEKNVGGYP